MHLLYLVTETISSASTDYDLESRGGSSTPTFCALGKLMSTPRNCRSSSSTVTQPPSLRSVVLSKIQLFPIASHKVGPPDVPGHLRQVRQLCKTRGLYLSAVIFYQYIASFFTAPWLCLCAWACIFRNLVCARSAKPCDCEDICTAFCRVACSELNEDDIAGAMPLEIKGTSRNAMSQSHCLETRDKQKAK